jgi:hypothetical protein
MLPDNVKLYTWLTFMVYCAHTCTLACAGEDQTQDLCSLGKQLCH